MLPTKKQRSTNRFERLKKRHGTPSIELIRVYTGLLVTGKNDFESVENTRNDDCFQRCMGIRKMPSTSRLRQRFDEDAIALKPLIEDSLADVVVNLKAPVSPLLLKLDKQQHIALDALDIDVFPMDNSGTKKEGVSYTYKGFDGYSSIKRIRDIHKFFWLFMDFGKLSRQHLQNPDSRLTLKPWASRLCFF